MSSGRSQASQVHLTPCTAMDHASDQEPRHQMVESSQEREQTRVQHPGQELADQQVHLSLPTSIPRHDWSPALAQSHAPLPMRPDYAPPRPSFPGQGQGYHRGQHQQPWRGHHKSSRKYGHQPSHHQQLSSHNYRTPQQDQIHQDRQSPQHFQPRTPQYQFHRRGQRSWRGSFASSRTYRAETSHSNVGTHVSLPVGRDIRQMGYHHRHSSVQSSTNDEDRILSAQQRLDHHRAQNPYLDPTRESQPALPEMADSKPPLAAEPQLYPLPEIGPQFQSQSPVHEHGSALEVQSPTFREQAPLMVLSRSSQPTSESSTTFPQSPAPDQQGPSPVETGVPYLSLPYPAVPQMVAFPVYPYQAPHIFSPTGFVPCPPPFPPQPTPYLGHHNQPPFIHSNWQQLPFAFYWGPCEIAGNPCVFDIPMFAEDV